MKLQCFAALALSVGLTSAAHAQFTSRMQVGNWNGGAYASPDTKIFGNCGLSLKFQSGTEFTVLMTNDYRALMVVIDPRIQTQPQARMGVPAKFDASDIQLQGTALSATMVQMPLPAIPNNYDIIRSTKRVAFTLPGLNAAIDVTGLDQALPKIFECVVAERSRMTLPPAPAQEQPVDRPEAVVVGLAVVEKLNLGPYIVFRDEARPGGGVFKNAPVVWGHAGVQGPGGAANILGVAAVRPVAPDATTAAAKAQFLAEMRGVGRTQIGDLPAIPGRADSFGVWSLGEAAYEEFYFVKRKSGGYYQVLTTTPIPGRKTAEAVGERYRTAIAAVTP